MRCTGCRVEKITRLTRTGAERLPRGWHQLHQETLCENCWAAQYLQRSFALPVDRVLLAEAPQDGKRLRFQDAEPTWALFCQDLHAAFRQSTALANWTMLELLRAEQVPLPGEKLPPLPARDRDHTLYKLATARFPNYPCANLNQTLNVVQRTYAQRRFDILARANCRGATFTYPYPYHVFNDAWTAHLQATAQGPEPCLRFSLPGPEQEQGLRRLGHRFTVALRVDQKACWRQLEALEALVAGRALQGTLTLTLQSCGTSRQNTLQTRAPGGGQRSYQRPLVRMALWVPRPAVAAGKKSMLLATDPQAFWVAEIGGRQAWVLNADHLKKVQFWVARHEAYLQRTAQDRKFERRTDRRSCKMLNESVQRRCVEQDRRMQTWCHTASKMVVEFAVRNRIGQVVYLDRGTPFPAFPWFRIKEQLRYKLQERQIEFCEGTPGEPEEVSEPS